MKEDKWELMNEKVNIHKEEKYGYLFKRTRYFITFDLNTKQETTKTQVSYLVLERLLEWKTEDEMK